MNRRLGAEIARMRSMWDSIETHCWPVNKLAAIVISHKPTWGKVDKTQEAPVGKTGTSLSLEDVLDVTRAPPSTIKDKRGMRSSNFVIVGYSRRRYKRKNASPYINAMRVKRGIYKPNSILLKNSKQPLRKPTYNQGWNYWFVMSREGVIYEAGEKVKCFPARFRIMETGRIHELKRKTRKRIERS